MWRFLYQLASPKFFYELTGRWCPKLGFFAFLLLFIGLGWGLIFAPPDYQQGEAFRIIYIHVPTAFMSILLYAVMGFCAVLLLVWRIKLAGLMLNGLAQTGALMAFLALITGSIWGKPMWGTWWVWDARLTSELILLFIYLAILAIGRTFKLREQGDKIVAVLSLVGMMDLPIIHYSVYWWNTLHQGATLSLLSKPKIALPMLYPLIISLIGFGLYCLWSVFSKARQELLIRERRQAWVKILLEEIYE